MHTECDSMQGDKQCVRDELNTTSKLCLTRRRSFALFPSEASVCKREDDRCWAGLTLSVVWSTCACVCAHVCECACASVCVCICVCVCVCERERERETEREREREREDTLSVVWIMCE